MRKDQICGLQRPRQGTAHDHVDVALHLSDVTPPPGLWPDPASAASGPHRTRRPPKLYLQNAQHSSIGMSVHT